MATGGPQGGRHERTPQSASGSGRRGVLIGAGVLGVAALGGGGALLAQGLGNDSGNSGNGGGSATASGSASASPTSTPRAVAALPDQAAKVPGTASTDLSKLKAPVALSFPRVPGARGLSEALDVAANKLLREHVYTGAKGDLTGSGKIFLAGADVLGAMILAKDAGGEAASVVYYRADHDRPFTSPGLIAEEKWAELEKAVATAAGELDGVDAASLATALQEQPRPWGNGPTILPAAGGALTLVFPAAKRGDQVGEVEVPLKAETVTPLLSEDGKAVMAAFAIPAGFDPKKVVVPGAGSTKGDKVYVQPPSVPAGGKPRTAEGPGPVSQLAPRSGAGVRPSAVAAPDATRLKAMALTFDDGPAPELNQKLRDTLNEHRAAATFFMIGQSVHAYPEWAAKTAANGYEIGSHSWSHKQLSARSGQRLTDEVVKPADAIAEACGRRPYVMRPPYGARNDRVDAAVGDLGESSQIWDVDTLDWKTLNVAKNLQNVQQGTRRGSIVLMHEIHPTSVRSVPQVLDWLGGQGFTMLTCSELGQNQMFAGKHYMQGLITHEIKGKKDQGPAASDGGH